MIRKVFISAVLLLSLVSISARAQTVDFIGACSYDSGLFEPAAVLQAFGPDRFGDTWARADFGLKNDPLSLDYAYFEVARSLTFWKDTPLKDLALHAEFNGYMNMDNCNCLFGVDYYLPFKDLVKLSLLYKTFNGNTTSSVPLQLSVLWIMKDMLGVDGLEFRGTFKAWGEDITYWYGEEKPLEHDPASFVIKASPQIWYSVGQFFGWKGLSVGGELELGYNYLGSCGFSISPMAAMRISF